MKKYAGILISLGLLLGSFINVSPANSAVAKYASDGSRCTKVGTPGNDTIRGTSTRDVICGLGGNDKIFGLGGNDTIDGGQGNDTIDGGLGDDSELGGLGKDALIGGLGADNLEGGLGKDNFDGGSGLNSCDLDGSLGEVRDYTCSLLPNLAFLLKRVKGSIISPGLNFDGCAMALHPYPGGGSAVVQGAISDGGKFEFDAPAGDYVWFVRAVDGSPEDTKKCAVYANMRIYAYHLEVSDSTPEVTISVPELVKTRIYVRSSRGVALRGASVTAQSNTPWGECPIVVNPSSLCARLDYFTLPKTVTNSQGYIEIMLPEGTRIQAYAQVKFAGVSMSSAWEQGTVTSGSSEVDLVIG